ncbi:poly A polymerase head domain protein [Neorickettsia helminthoeca str. Oregon]|uniref:Poly A polymerase head domain protein n=1 Tax=Neorickettsia helminthoeca str. Oregon TaxID=1286528 RepID=X5H4F3_9RICK|nr:CCA tRNA nucleotidyltransferase [Neorickettsia helminthoeca]AHX11553.1 poly A polymerase head domain protein [Neorickettsia helminthoeca str. Oregon]
MKIETSWLNNFRQLIQIIRNNAGEARFVGGCVRDSILGRKISDFDIATTLEPEEAMSILRANSFTAIPTGLKHGTFTTLVGSRSVEITTLRKDLECDGRHATVMFTENWKEDAKRRDFTFNALYMDIDGNVYDYFSGLEDLKYRRLKFVGDPCKRIEEDYLRILRVFRFQANICKLPIGMEILEACEKYKEQINLLSGERIQAEMLKLLSYDNFLSTLEAMQSAKVLERVFNTEILFSKIDAERTHQLRDPIAALALLIRNTVDNYDLQWLYQRWRFSKKIYQMLDTLILENHIASLQTTASRLGKDLANKLLKILYAENKINDKEYQQFSVELISSSVPVFPLFGRDLTPLGYKGPELGRILKYLKTLWEESGCRMNRQELLSRTKKYDPDNIGERNPKLR